MKRVICMVPSLTETLLAANLEVVGRTRYCIHPAEKVARIPIVGGTKDVRWSLLEPLSADLLILDQEENPKRFAEQSPIEYFSTHITSVDSVAKELARLATHLQSTELMQISRRWQAVCAKKTETKSPLPPEFWNHFPGVVEWWKRPEMPISQVLYIIWRNPWMTIAKPTFIGSILQHLGVDLLPQWSTNYPKFEFEDYVKADTLLLFSSEPYDFSKEREELMKLNHPSALVDGEKFSWYGVRALEFLESIRS